MPGVSVVSRDWNDVTEDDSTSARPMGTSAHEQLLHEPLRGWHAFSATFRVMFKEEGRKSLEFAKKRQMVLFPLLLTLVTAITTIGLQFLVGDSSAQVSDIESKTFTWQELRFALHLPLLMFSLGMGTFAFMGHDATMEVGNSLTIYADSKSTKFKEKLISEEMDSNIPIYQYDPASGSVDGVTSATAKYFADKGLLWTYRDGKRVDSTHLHLREWLSCIRNGGIPSCNIKEGFEEAITSHMGGLSYKLGRRIDWDKTKQEIVRVEEYDLDEVLLENKEKIT